MLFLPAESWISYFVRTALTWFDTERCDILKNTLKAHKNRTMYKMKRDELYKYKHHGQKSLEHCEHVPFIGHTGTI